MQACVAQHPAVMAILFPAVWALVSFLFSYLSGWATLARQFRCRSKFLGNKWHMRSGHFRYGVSYKSILTVGSDKTGLYLAVFLPFRLGSPPLLIPWTEILVTRKRILWLDFVKLSLGRQLAIPLQLKAGLAEKIRNAAGFSWPEQPILSITSSQPSPK